MSTPERRRNRTPHRGEAMRLYLEALRVRTRAAALALADDDGLLVAGAGPARAQEALAAYAPLADRPAALGGRPLTAASFVVDGARLHLAGLASGPLPVDEARAAVGRILG